MKDDKSWKLDERRTRASVNKSGNKQWAHAIPLGLRLGLWLMIAIVGGLLLWAALTNTSVSTVVPGRWEGGSSQSIFVFRAWLPIEDRSKLVPGTEAKVFWLDAPAELDMTKGKLATIAAEPTSLNGFESAYVLEIELEGTVPIPVGLTGEAQLSLGHKKILEVFWAWLRGVG